MKMKTFVTFFLISLLSIISVASAFTISDDGDYMIEGTVSQDGDTISGGNYIATIAIAQPMIGNIDDDYFFGENAYKMCLGVFCTYIFEPDYSVRLSGNLKYLDGRIISNGNAWIAVEYLNLRFIGGKTKTDSSGNFNSRVAIPESIYDKDFDINIFASGEVDAVYECTYSQATNVCS